MGVSAADALKRIQGNMVFGLEFIGNNSKKRRFAYRPALRDAYIDGDVIVLPTYERVFSDFVPIHQYFFVPLQEEVDMYYVGDQVYDTLRLYPLFKTVEEIDGENWEAIVERVDGVKFRSRDTLTTAILLNLETNPGITYGKILGIIYELAPDNLPEKRDPNKWFIIEMLLAHIIGMLVYEAGLIEIQIQ